MNAEQIKALMKKEFARRVELAAILNNPSTPGEEMDSAWSEFVAIERNVEVERSMLAEIAKADNGGCVCG